MDLTSVRLLLILGLVVAAQAQNCERPVPGANMGLKDDSILLETFLNGAVASFRCDVGYTSAGGSSSVTCGDCSWSPVKLKCERKSCGSAGEVDHGNVDYPKGNQFGDKAVLSCNRGYNMVGGSGATRFCGDQGWTGRFPECQAINCDPPQGIQNGDFIPKKEDFYGISEVVKYTCQKPYTLKGSKSLTCSEAGVFKPDPPECINVNCDEPVVENGKLSGSRPPHKHLNSVTFQCDAGYFMVGERTQTCDINEKWSPGLPKCKEKVAATTKATTTTSSSTTTTTTPSGKQKEVSISVLVVQLYVMY
ncbi:membrane cofactor protein-like [Limanda limanda]|uniref:membrane cofactor protein-like n=1 Tax=Limanda limanda TaxID=27771 RepID=UPI0029C74B14|nr:membrane cofactor protein-like [Limanda limanda]